MLDKFNRRSIRLQSYDYSQEGLYFITICCQDRIHRFGEVINGEMVLNQYGKIAEKEWLNTEKIRPNVQLCEYVIMPNHMHGIIIICTGELNSPTLNTSTRTGESHSPTIQQKGEFNSPLRGTSNTVGAIVRGYKSAVTKWMRQNSDVHALWQRNYYEHIIRDEKSYQNISLYIQNNPFNWQNDKFY